MTLSFEVETSNIGTVNVFLVFSGKAVTIMFELEDKTVSDLANEMHQEICDALVSRGFAVSSVDFTIREEIAEDLQQTQNLDIIG